jgi:hypothetical protein
MPDLLVDNKTIYNLEYGFITYFGYITKITVLLFMIGFFQTKPTSFLKINFVIKIIISLFLIYRFNSYRSDKVKFTELDRKVAYSAGMYIFTISFIDVLDPYVEKIRSEITKYTLPFIENVKK